jgi:hypothetical protein
MGARLTAVTMIVGAMALAGGLEARAAQVDLELFAPTRDAMRAIDGARRAKAPDLAPQEMREADRYLEEARTALAPAEGQPDVAKATRFARLAAAQGKVAETRAIEIVRDREAAAAGNQYLQAVEPDYQRLLPPRPGLAESSAEYRNAQREAAAARAARRAAQDALEGLRSESR